MCNHISKVIKWGVGEGQSFAPLLWGCINCDATSDKAFKSEESEPHDHDEYVEGCFACKVKTLELSPGDAKSGFIDNGYTQRKWDNELKAYRDARAQGIQPKSTKLKDIQAAVDKSNKSGKAYDSSKQF